jgi:hypothetical protein
MQINEQLVGTEGLMKTAITDSLKAESYFSGSTRSDLFGEVGSCPLLVS